MATFVIRFNGTMDVSAFAAVESNSLEDALRQSDAIDPATLDWKLDSQDDESPAIIPDDFTETYVCDAQDAAEFGFDPAAYLAAQKEDSCPRRPYPNPAWKTWRKCWTMATVRPRTGALPSLMGTVSTVFRHGSSTWVSSDANPDKAPERRPAIGSHRR